MARLEAAEAAEAAPVTMRDKIVEARPRRSRRSASRSGDREDGKQRAEQEQPSKISANGSKTDLTFAKLVSVNSNMEESHLKTKLEEFKVSQLKTNKLMEKTKFDRSLSTETRDSQKTDLSEAKLTNDASENIKRYNINNIDSTTASVNGKYFWDDQFKSPGLNGDLGHNDKSKKDVDDIKSIIKLNNMFPTPDPVNNEKSKRELLNSIENTHNKISKMKINRQNTIQF